MVDASALRLYSVVEFSLSNAESVDYTLRSQLVN
jgi:hypothetical protein